MKMHDGELNIGADLAAEPADQSSLSRRDGEHDLPAGLSVYVRLPRQLGEQMGIAKLKTA